MISWSSCISFVEIIDDGWDCSIVCISFNDCCCSSDVKDFDNICSFSENDASSSVSFPVVCSSLKISTTVGPVVLECSSSSFSDSSYFDVIVLLICFSISGE